MFLPLLRDAVGQSPRVSEQLLPAIEALSPGMDAAAADRALTGLLLRPDCAPPRWPSLSRVLAAVCRRLPPSDAAAHVNRAVDYILAARAATEEKDKSNYAF